MIAAGTLPALLFCYNLYIARAGVGANFGLSVAEGKGTTLNRTGSIFLPADADVTAAGFYTCFQTFRLINHYRNITATGL